MGPSHPGGMWEAHVALANSVGTARESETGTQHLGELWQGTASHASFGEVPFEGKVLCFPSGHLIPET